MKKYLLKVSGIAVMAALLSTAAFSQAREKLERESNKMGDNDEVIIIKKGNKDTKVTVEVKDGEVLVNGKPLDEYKDDDVIVRRNRSLYNGNARVFTPSSPFRGQGWSYDSDVFDANRAYLGVSTEKSDRGARVTNVTDKSAADRAGLKEGDVITRVDDTKIEDHDDLSAAIRKHKPEDKVSITYLRDDRENKVTATLGKISTAVVAPTFPELNHNYNFDF
ncbi:MAG TPA: PDZ domain-containing protein, partial [Chitinophagaceae bacterium]|nr:PDZ domain-containing protein [Chitinophagaceae bacterium]